MIRVLLVDDSPVALAVLSRMIQQIDGVTVAGTALGGAEALELIPKLQPHVVCTDLHMPNINGLMLVRAIMARHPLPILVISISVQHHGDDIHIFQLLDAGAVDVFPKPKGGLQDINQSLVHQLAEKIRVLASVIPGQKRLRKAPQQPVLQPEYSWQQPATAQPAMLSAAAMLQTVHDLRARPRLVAIGASTGGPQALKTLFARLPGDWSLPILCVQHISHGFLSEFMQWLSRDTALSIRVATPGHRPRGGCIYFAPERSHLTVDNEGCFVIPQQREQTEYHPSIDQLFHSVARCHGQYGAGILLTGMGSDGAEGLLAMAQRGALTVAQDQDSCVVFDLPRQAIERQACRYVLSLNAISDLLKSMV
ncbi:MAG: chemotaxis-specific protein-glutamate methyltransferase CheB [Magnetococcales bacterium]|nr:chemotaxis-specific protein-glutamate methyltransferase CheB [Magnetococcales bacterium]